jgi:FkbM family methyltransferase
MRLDLREGIQRSLFLGVYEPIETEWFKECVGPGDTFVDVGANFGHYTFLGASRVGPTGKVFSFEPSPHASKVIEAAISDSGISNVVLVKSAVGKTAGSVSLYLPNTPDLHSPSILFSDTNFIPIQIQVVSLDTFEAFESIRNIKLVKMDVEGYEPDVLKGMEKLIGAGKVENVFCEFNSGWLKRNSTTPKELMERFLDSGFTIHRQTKLHNNLPSLHGEPFELQDIWFRWRKS